MSGFTAIDLEKLPAPEVIKAVEFDALFEEMKAEAIRITPDVAPFLALESEPATKVLRVCAYFRMLDRLEFNDGARANMLALATGSDLDNLAAFWGVERLVIQEADKSVTPPIEELKEADTDFRKRIQLSLEGHTTAGPRGSYLYHAQSADGDVKHAGVQSPNPGEVLVTILSNIGDGVPSAALLSTVEAALNDEDVRPLTDQVTVQAASLVNYQVDATLTLYPGPDATAVEAAANAALTSYIEANHRLGHDITLSGIYSALHQPGVQKVALAQPGTDLTIGEHQAPFCTSKTVAIGGRDV